MEKERLPKGQKWISKPVVYDIVRDIKDVDLSKYRLRFFGFVENPLELTYDEFVSMANDKVVADFHCVTTWSVKDIVWEGVKTKKLLELVKPKKEAKFVMAHCLEGYTTNFPIEYLYDENSMLAYKMNGEIIPKRHGFPIRLVIPSLYAWKSAKYLEALEFMSENRKGFWELRGYHDIGDPWKEERFSED
ncbi:MAG: sulfite oxidase-like oxidoreductase [Hydrogenobaculum sp.]